MMIYLWCFHFLYLQPVKYDKMEKADILDLTVQYLNKVQAEPRTSPVTVHHQRALPRSSPVTVHQGTPPVLTQHSSPSACLPHPGLTVPIPMAYSGNTLAVARPIMPTTPPSGTTGPLPTGAITGPAPISPCSGIRPTETSSAFYEVRPELSPRRHLVSEVAMVLKQKPDSMWRPW